MVVEKEAVTEVYYDANGNKVRVVDANNTTIENYDDQKATTYTYSAQDKVLTETDQAGNTTSYQYDKAGNRTSMTGPRGNVMEGDQKKYTGDFTITYEYNNLGRLIRGHLPKSPDSTDDEDTSEDDGEGYGKPTVELEYNARGNLLKRIVIKVYYYVTSRQEEYGYDTAGNRTSELIRMRQTKEREHKYYNNSNLLKTNSKYAFVYDPNGNLIRKGNSFTINGDTVNLQADSGEYWEYEYDLRNRLTAVKKKGVTVAQYTYDSSGLRVKKVNEYSETTYFVYNSNDQIIYQEQENQGYMEYIYVRGKHFARVDGKIGVEETETYFYHTDHLGSTVLVTDEETKTVWSSEYTPFGYSWFGDHKNQFKNNLTSSMFGSLGRVKGTGVQELIGSCGVDFAKDYLPQKISGTRQVWINRSIYSWNARFKNPHTKFLDYNIYQTALTDQGEIFRKNLVNSIVETSVGGALTYADTSLLQGVPMFSTLLKPRLSYFKEGDRVITLETLYQYRKSEIEKRVVWKSYEDTRNYVSRLINFHRYENDEYHYLMQLNFHLRKQQIIDAKFHIWEIKKLDLKKGPSIETEIVNEYELKSYNR